MSQNLVVQLLLRTGTFSTDLKTARGQVQNFQKGCQTAGKSLAGFGQSLGINIGTLAKFGGAIGAAALAGKGLKSVIDSTQSSSDAFQGVIAGCKGVLDTFITAIATADFTAFSDGLWGVYDAAKAVQDAIDQLQNTQLAYDYKSKQNMTDFQESYNVFKDPASTDKMKEDAKAQMKAAVDAQFEYARNYSSALYNTYVAQVVKKAGGHLRRNNVTIAQFEKAMNIDLSENPAAGRAEIERQYGKYLSKLKEFKGNNLTAQEDLKKRYRDVIAIHAMLELMKDDELKGVAQLLMGMEDVKQQALSMQKTYNRVTGTKETAPKQTKTTTTKKEELDIQEESLTYWKRIADEEKRYRDAVIADTEAWNEHNDKLEEALQKVKEIDAHMEAMASRKNWITLPEVDNSGISKEATTNEGKPKLTGVAQPKELYTEVELQEKINKLLEKRKKLKEGSKELAENNKALAEYKTRLDALQNYGIDKVLNIKNDTLSSIQSLTSGLHTLSDAFSKLIGDTAGTKNAFSKFLDIVQVGINVFQAMASIIQTVNSLQQIEANTATTTATTEIAAEEAKALAKKKSTVQAEEAAQANMKEAVSGAAASQASIPGVGPLLAVAAVAAVLAAIVSAMTSIKSSSSKFANGGIVGGNSFTGDRVTANVNSGEMVLTRAQQANLFRLANGVGTTGGNQVEFHISGTDLVGVLNNNNRKNRLVR